MTKERIEQLMWENPLSPNSAAELIVEFCDKKINRIPNNEELQKILYLGQLINWRYIITTVAKLNGYELIIITKDGKLVAMYLQ